MVFRHDESLAIIARLFVYSFALYLPQIIIGH